MSTAISERCRIARDAAKLTQKEAAKQLQITERTLRRYEQEYGDSLKTYQSMAKLYKCSLTWLLMDIGSMREDARATAASALFSALPEYLREAAWRYLHHTFGKDWEDK